MLQDLCKLFSQRVADTRYFETVAGLVTVQEQKQIEDGGRTLISRYPVSSDIEGRPDLDGVIRDLVPDSTKRGISYFEGFDTRRGRRYTFGQQFLSSIRLVCWLNRDLITGNSTDAVNSQIILELLTSLVTVKYEAPPFRMIGLTMTGVTENNANIFAAYTYNNAENQFLMAPYTYFAIDFQASFVLPFAACGAGLQLNVKQC